MTVQDLINELEKIKDKTKEIKIAIPTEGVTDWPVSVVEDEESVCIAGA